MTGSQFGTCVEAYKPYLAMLFIQFVYAGMALFSKAAISGGMNPFVFVVYRQAIATVTMAPFAYFLESKKAPPMSLTLLCKIFFVALFGITSSLNLYSVALNYTSATFAAMSMNAVPVITFILSAMLRIESISTRQFHGWAKVFGSVICVSGAFMMAFYKGPPIKMLSWYPSVNRNTHKTSNFTSYSKKDWVKGSLIMLAANAAWSVWLVAQAPIVQSYPAKLLLTTVQCFFSSIQSAVVAVVFERSPSAWRPGWDIHLLSVTYCGVIVTGISYWLQVWCIEKKGPVVTSMFTPLAFLITAIFSAFLWKETLHLGSIVGAVLVVAGLYAVLWGKNREDRIKKEKGQRQDIHGETILECVSTHR